MKHNTTRTIKSRPSSTHVARTMTLQARSNQDGMSGLMIGIAWAAKNASVAQIVSGHSVAFCQVVLYLRNYNGPGIINTLFGA